MEGAIRSFALLLHISAASQGVYSPQSEKVQVLLSFPMEFNKTMRCYGRCHDCNSDYTMKNRPGHSVLGHLISKQIPELNIPPTRIP